MKIKLFLASALSPLLLASYSLPCTLFWRQSLLPHGCPLLGLPGPSALQMHLPSALSSTGRCPPLHLTSHLRAGLGGAWLAGQAAASLAPASTPSSEHPGSLPRPPREAGLSCARAPAPPRPGEPHHDFELKVAARRCSGGLAGRKVRSGPPMGNSESFSLWNSESPAPGWAVYADTGG